MYDLILRDGTVWNTRSELDGTVCDVAIEDGIIRKVAPSIPESGLHEMDLSGMTVTPGLIDFHAHFYEGGAGTCLRFSQYLATGVTNAVDAGSAGSSNLESFLSSQTELERRNTLVYLYCSSEGLAPLPDHNESIDPAFFNRKRIIQLCRRYPDRICGLKLRISAPVAQKSGVSGFDALRAGVELAGECGLPISVHIPDFEGELDELLEILRPGDIFCHVFTPKKGIMDGDSLCPAILWGREKGILMESACGKGHLGHRVVRAALRERFYPDIISGDFTKATYTFPPAGTLPYLMSRFMALGMSFQQVLDCCTTSPAQKMGMENTIGSLKEGCCANIAVFQRQQGRFSFRDVEQDVVSGTEFLIPQVTVLEGSVVFNQLTYGSRCH